MRLFFFVFLMAASVVPAISQPFANVQVNVATSGTNETSITINPLNPDNIVGAAQVPCIFYHSFDGGTTWGEGYLPDLYDLGDPAVAFDRSGNVYFCYIGIWSHSGIFVNRSTDGGQTWMATGTPLIEHEGSVPFEDKSYPCTDWTDGPHSGNVYVCWTQFSHYGSTSPADSTWILFSRSTDQAQSFDEPLRISDKGGNAIDSDDTVEGAVPTVGPDGTIYVAWSGPRGIEIDKSTDGGVTFGTDRFVTDQIGGWDYSVPGIYRANGLPITEADISNGPYSGRIYVNWTDERNGDVDVFTIYSDDGGETWGPVVRVNDDPVGNGAHQFFTWIDVDPITGYVYVVFYDRRAHPPGSELTDVYLAISQDGGSTYSNIRISESPFDPNPSIFFGDYTGISAYDGKIRPFWTRMDTDLRSVWTALIDLPTTVIGGLDQDLAGSLLIAPNPIRTMARIYPIPAHEAGERLMIYDIQGRLVRTLTRDDRAPGTTWFEWDVRNGEGTRVAPGIYLVGQKGRESARVVVLP